MASSALPVHAHSPRTCFKQMPQYDVLLFMNARPKLLLEDRLLSELLRDLRELNASWDTLFRAMFLVNLSPNVRTSLKPHAKLNFFLVSLLSKKVFNFQFYFIFYFYLLFFIFLFPPYIKTFITKPFTPN